MTGIVIALIIAAVVIAVMMKSRNTTNTAVANSTAAQPDEKARTDDKSADDKKPSIDAIKNALKDLVEAAFSRELSYEETMKWFIAHKNDKSEYAQGALLKEKTENGFIVTQFFLDENNNVVDGRRMNVTGLDKELLDVFGDEDLLIVK